MLLKFPVEIFEWVEDISEFTEDFIKIMVKTQVS